MRSLAFLGCCLLAFTVHPARANDSTYAERNGGIVLLKQADISMAREELFLSEERVEVNYVFVNRGRKSLTVAMAFPMPKMLFIDSDVAVIENFELWVDGKKIRTERRIVARLPNGEDITPALRKLGWSERDMRRALELDAPKLRTSLPKAWLDKEGRPRYELNENFIWNQTFASGVPVQVRHRYTPALSSSVPQSADHLIENQGKVSCMDVDFKRSLRALPGSHAITWASLGYVLTTGAHWNGPIGEFVLRVQKKDPKDLLSLCMTGGRKVDALTFEFRRSNYTPDRDLDVFFARALKMEE